MSELAVGERESGSQVSNHHTSLLLLQLPHNGSIDILLGSDERSRKGLLTLLLLEELSLGLLTILLNLRLGEHSISDLLSFDSRHVELSRSSNDVRSVDSLERYTVDLVRA